jgi:hypothetical protein
MTATMTTQAVEQAVDIRSYEQPLFNATLEYGTPQFKFCYCITVDSDGISTIHVAKKNEFTELGSFFDWDDAKTFIDSLITSAAPDDKEDDDDDEEDDDDDEEDDDEEPITKILKLFAELPADRRQAVFADLTTQVIDEQRHGAGETVDDRYVVASNR